MSTDIDIYRSAAVLIAHHCEGAKIEAAMRADAMLNKGNLDSQRVWRSIILAVDELQQGTPSGRNH